MNNSKKKYYVKMTDTVKEATAQYFSGKQYRKDKVAELFREIYNGATGDFLLSIFVDEDTDNYSVKLVPIHSATEAESDIPKTESYWEISSDGCYPYCNRCHHSFTSTKRALPKSCPKCGAKMIDAQ